jgi:ribose/xylose/arabinose/galactoside ABC-type transport system permease subunit
MALTFRSLLLLAAVILFVLAAVGIDLSGISLVALGLACFAGSFIAPDKALSSRR